MLKIRIDAVDRIFALINDIGVLTYLQGLVQNDVEEQDMIDKKLGFVYKEASSYLLENQLEKISELSGILTDDRTFFD